MEADLVKMLETADDLDDARDMVCLEEFLHDFHKSNGIRKMIVGIMRKRGWRKAYETYLEYVNDGCGIRG